MTASFHFVKIKLFDAVADWRFLSLAVQAIATTLINCAEVVRKSKSSLNDDFDFCLTLYFCFP